MATRPNRQSSPGAIGNNPGMVTPRPDPNGHVEGGKPTQSTNPAVKPETAQEGGFFSKAGGYFRQAAVKAGEILEMGEISALNRAKNSVMSGIDSAVGSAGGGVIASAVGAVGKGAVEIFMPTNIVDFVPMGKALSGGRKVAKFGEKALEQTGKSSAEKITKETVEKGAKQGAENAAKKVEKNEIKAAEKSNGGYSKKKKNVNPCDHPNDKKRKRKYVVYKADEFNKAGEKVGTYVGRTSGAPGESTKSILGRRLSGHHRNLGPLQSIFETDSYAGVRGAEHLMRDKHGTVNQINPVGPKNPRKDDYIDCAKSKGVS